MAPLVFLAMMLVAPAALGAIDSMEFLQKFGYMNGMTGYAADTSSAVKAFQKMAGLPLTGIVDKATQEKMDTPRCGGSDIKIQRMGYASSKWSKNSLTYKFLSHTPDLNRNTVKDIIRNAFQVWADVTPLRFTEVSSGRADLNVDFRYSSHSDGFPFDGKGGVLAHAFFPADGRVHFDEAEQWVDGRTSNGNTNLFYTAAHEIGHAIGLDHINNNKALMNPYHIDFGSRRGWRLPSVDKYNIQRVYGAGTGTGTGTGTGNGSCKDNDSSCGFFQSQGHCRSSSQYYRYMRTNCKKSCRYC